MKKIYYSLWSILLHFSWPVRLLFELIVITALILITLSILEKTRILNIIKKYIIIFLVNVMTNIVYFTMGTSDRAKEIDSRIEQWGGKVVETHHRLPRKAVFISVIIVYIMAVFVDTPITKAVSSEYLTEFQNFQSFCLKIESKVSGGVEIEVTPVTLINASVNEDGFDEDIYIKLNDKGSNGANVRVSPSLDASIIGWVNSSSDIIYDNDFRFDGQRYWLWIKVDGEKIINGWISGNLVDGKQLEQIVNTNTPRSVN